MPKNKKIKSKKIKVNIKNEKTSVTSSSEEHIKISKIIKPKKQEKNTKISVSDKLFV